MCLSARYVFRFLPRSFRQGSFSLFSRIYDVRSPVYVPSKMRTSLSICKSIIVSFINYFRFYAYVSLKETMRLKYTRSCSKSLHNTGRTTFQGTYSPSKVVCKVRLWLKSTPASFSWIACLRRFEK